MWTCKLGSWPSSPRVLFPRSSGTADAGWLQGPISTLWAGILQECPTLRQRKTYMNLPMAARSWAWPLASPLWKSFHSEWLPTIKLKRPWTFMIQQGRFLEKNVIGMTMMRQNLDPLEVSSPHAPSWNNTPFRVQTHSCTCSVPTS